METSTLLISPSEEPKKLSLTELLSEERSMMDKIFDAEGEILPDLEQAMILSGEAIARKIDSYSFVMKRLQAEADFRKKEAEEHTAIRKKCEKAIERMEDSLKDTMLFHKMEELKGIKTKFIIGTTSRPSIELADSEHEIPQRFLRTKIELDKEAVYLAYKMDALTEDEKKLFRFTFKETLREKANTEPKKLK